MPIRSHFPLTSLLLLTAAHWSAAEDWPQFRGPNCTGISSAKKALPQEFSTTKNVVWSFELGEGVSSPVVSAGRVFATGIQGRTAPPALPKDVKDAPDLGPDDSHKNAKFVVFAFDAATGSMIWQTEYPIGKKPFPHINASTSYASATPAADAERVYVYFSRLGLMALDAQTGEKVWRLSVSAIPEPYYIFDWGPGMSPVLYKDMLFFCQDDDVSPALYAVDKKTGKILWKDDRSDIAVCYSHPVICETAKGPELVVAGTGKLIGYDIKTGKRKWASELFCRNIKTTPVVQGDTIYVTVESYGMSYQWRATADKNKDGKITREEIINSRLDKSTPIPDAFWKKFERGDVNKDGVLEGDEIDKAFMDPSNQGGILNRDAQARGKGTDWEKWNDELQKEGSIQAVRGGGKGDVTKTHTLWKVSSKLPDHLVSPLVVDGRMWLVKGKGLISCIDVKKGDKLWEKERLNNDSTYLGCPVFADGKIYIPAENGKIVVLENGPKLKVLARNDMGETIAATPAIADGRLYIRTRNNLYCIAEPTK